MLPAALLAAVGTQAQSPARPLPTLQPLPPPPSDPHKNPSAVPCVTKLPAEFVAAGGSVMLALPPAGPQATDRTFWIKIQTASSSVLAEEPLCAVQFGTPYAKVPTVQATVASKDPVFLYPANIQPSRFDLVSSGPFPPRQDITVMVTVTPWAGAPSFGPSRGAVENPYGALAAGRRS